MVNEPGRIRSMRLTHVFVIAAVFTRRGRIMYALLKEQQADLTAVELSWSVFLRVKQVSIGVPPAGAGPRGLEDRARPKRIRRRGAAVRRQRRNGGTCVHAPAQQDECSHSFHGELGHLSNTTNAGLENTSDGCICAPMTVVSIGPGIQQQSTYFLPRSFYHGDEFGRKDAHNNLSPLNIPSKSSSPVRLLP